MGAVTITVVALNQFQNVRGSPYTILYRMIFFFLVSGEESGWTYILLLNKNIELKSWRTLLHLVTAR